MWICRNIQQSLPFRRTGTSTATRFDDPVRIVHQKQITGALNHDRPSDSARTNTENMKL
jgi:hypothetical protein